MRIDEPAALITAVGGARLQQLSAAWRVGQILDAMVLRVSNVGTATLNVNNTAIDVRTSVALTVGARLQLEVAQTGAQIVLRAVTPAPSNKPVAEAIRTLLPRQASVAPVLARLAAMAAPSSIPRGGAAAPDSTPTLPPPLVELARQVMSRVATLPQVATPDGLRQAIKQAGPFFEHALVVPPPMAGTSAASTDLKAGLLQLLAYVRSAIPSTPAATPHPAVPAARTTPVVPGTKPSIPAPAGHAPDTGPPLQLLDALENEIGAALARITLQQLAALPRHETDGAPQYLLDLPLRYGERVDVARLHIFREKHRRDPQQPPAWCVRLSFDLATLGPVSVLVTLLGNAVAVAMWAQRESTARLFDAHLQELRAKLHASGVNLNRLQCDCGVAPFATDALHALKHRGLIDEHA